MRRSLVFPFLLFISGAAALMYEIAWVRQFSQVLGASSHAVTLTLTTFMAGLALGSWVLGKTADRLGERGLAGTYVSLEACIGLYALILPALLAVAESVLVWFHRTWHPVPFFYDMFRFAVSFCLLILPTTLIGGTLPVLSRFLIRSRNLVSTGISRLYAANTLGAVAGTLAAGYALLPQLGIRFTTFVAVGMNVFVAVVFWYLCRGKALSRGRTLEPAPAEGRVGTGMNRLQQVVVMGFFFSGFAAMLYEVAWTRTLQMILGTTTFAFTTMLSTFLVGIALGSLAYRLVSRYVSPATLFVVLQVVIGLSALFTVPLFEKLPFLFISLRGSWADSWLDVQVVRFVLAALVMAVPTLAMGTLLPAVSALVIERTGHLGGRLGKAFAWNTFGNLLGASAAGFILVPLVGMQKTIIAGAVLNLGAGCGVLLLGWSDSKVRVRLAAAAASMAGFVVLLGLIEPWAPRVLNSGVYVYAQRYLGVLDRYSALAHARPTVSEASSWAVLETAMTQYDLMYYDAGPVSTVAVMERNDGVRFLTIDGKTDASTGGTRDMRTQVMIGQLPLLLHRDPDKVLVVGLGSGITAGSVLTHDVRAVDCAEISPSVIEAASMFREASHDALSDDRLRIIPRDARNLLLTSEQSYDVIISQPSNPWISGESSLFTLEWYRLVRERLQGGGLFLQWVPSYLMSRRDLKVIIHTLRDVFPHLSSWTSGSLGDLIFIARKNVPLKVDYDAFLQTVSSRPVSEDIERVGLHPRLLPFDLFVMNEEELPGYLYSSLNNPLEKNTDDHVITEFSTPKQLFRRSTVDRFQDPNRLHGNLESLGDILENVTEGDLRKLLGEKPERHT